MAPDLGVCPPKKTRVPSSGQQPRVHPRTGPQVPVSGATVAAQEAPTLRGSGRARELPPAVPCRTGHRGGWLPGERGVEETARPRPPGRLRCACWRGPCGRAVPRGLLAAEGPHRRRGRVEDRGVVPLGRGLGLTLLGFLAEPGAALGLFLLPLGLLAAALRAALLALDAPRPAVLQRQSTLKVQEVKALRAERPSLDAAALAHASSRLAATH